MERFGISDAQLEDLAGTAASGGVELVWRTTQAWLSQQEEKVIAAYEAEKKRGETAALAVQRSGGSDLDALTTMLGQRTLEDRKAAALQEIAGARTVQQPIWRDISGLNVPEFAMTPGERAGRIRKLLRAVERVARVEVRAEEARCGGDWRGLRALTDENGEEDGRSFAWDPLRSICYYFGIAKTKLGAYAWEIWGLSAPQIVDRVKCEAVRGALRAEVRAFVENYYKEHAGAEVEEVWAALRQARKGLGFRTALAARLGFSSYARYFRACVLCYGIEPSELEREVFEELVTEPGAVVKQNDGEGESQKLEGESNGEVGNGRAEVVNGEFGEARDVG